MRKIGAHETSLETPDKPPVSCVGWLDAFLGVGVMLGLFFGLRHDNTLSDARFCALMVAALGLALGAVEILRAPWRKIRPAPQQFSEILKRAAVKYIGFLAGLAFIGFLYWVFPEYHREYYNRYFDMVFLILPFLPVIFAAYFLYAEWRFPAEKDGSWHAGMFMLGKWEQVDSAKLRHNIFCWLVKGYFLAIMFGDLSNGLARFRTADWNFFHLNFMAGFDLLFNSIVVFELVFVSAGYALACRLFSSQIRTVEKTLFGWTVAIMSYGPFLSLVYRNYFGYRGGDISWKEWLAGHEMLMVVWGSVIIVLLCLHMWCDACFGVRFSNLTNRGIITNGPFYFCKHPAYIIKSLRWWMVSVPFATAAGWEEALRFSLLLVFVNILYLVRSYTEERLLSSDPGYVAYGLWMDQHSIFSWLGKIFPSLRYANRLKKWKERGELQPVVDPGPVV